MTGTTPLDWFWIFLIGAPASRRFVSDRATPPPRFDKQGLDYTKIDVTENLEALDYIKGLGYQQAPVVMAGDNHWSGFRPDRIKAVAVAAAAATPLAVGQA